MQFQKPKIIFLNQMAGPLFRELAEDLSAVWSPSLLYTGHPQTISVFPSPGLEIKAGPIYDRTNNLTRLVSWLRYFFQAFKLIVYSPRSSLLFIVSNPPFIGLLGLFCKIIRKQKYVLLIYDIYPDVLLALNYLRPGLISKLWNLMNRLIVKNAELIFTLSEDMRQKLENKLDRRTFKAKDLLNIHGWADLEVIKPLEKQNNWFAQKYDLQHKTTILYSGNMGKSHNIELILDIAERFSNSTAIHFLFIGEGEKYHLVKEAIKNSKANNITILPFQSEKNLPYSLTTGDLGIVSFEDGLESCLFPSKAYYYLAAGLPLLLICNKPNELTKIIAENHCGFQIGDNDPAQAVEIIRRICADKLELQKYKIAARQTAEKLFSRRNSQKFISAIANKIFYPHGSP